MSVLTSLTSSPPNVPPVSVQPKNSVKNAVADFLSILESGITGLDATIAPSLMDSLYDQDAAAKPVAAPIKTAVEASDDNAPAVQSPPSEQTQNNSDDGNANNHAASASPKQSSLTDKNNQPASKDKAVANDSTTNSPVKTSTPKNAVNDNAGDASAKLADAIRNKVQSISDLLGAIASLLAANQQGASTLITLTQTTTNIQSSGSAGTLPAGINLAALNGQLNQLLLQTNNTSDGAQTSGDMAQALQQVSNLLAQTPAAQEGAVDMNALLQSLTGSEKTIATLAAATASKKTATHNGDNALLPDLLTQMQQDLGALKKLLGTQVANHTATTADIAQASDSSAFIKQAAITPATDSKIIAATGAPVVSDSTQVNINTTTITAVAVEAKANPGGNFSGGQSEQQGNNGMATPLAVTSTNNGASLNVNSTFSKMLSQTAHVPVQDQIANVLIKSTPKDGSSKIEIQLDPESLGKVSVKMDMGKDGTYRVVISADNQSTLELLQRDASNLQKALSDAGLQTDGGSLSFNLRGGDQQKGQSHASNTYQKSQPEEDELAPLSIITRSYTVSTHDGLNIEI